MKRTIDKLRECIREQRYSISLHANKEMSDDDLISVDLENAILTGRVTKGLRRIQERHDTKLLDKLATAAQLR